MSIGRQLLLAFFTLTLTLFGLFGFSVYRGFQQQLRAEAQASILGQGQLMVALLERSPFNSWPEQLKRAALASQTRIRVVDQSYSSVFDSKPKGRVLGAQSGSASVVAEEQIEGVHFGRGVPEDNLPGERHSVLTVSLNLPLMQHYRLLMTRSLLPVELELESIQFVVTLAGLVMLVVTAIGGFVLSKWLSQPLDQLVALAEQYGRGNFEARKKVTGAREMVALSNRLHVMAQQLEARERRLESYVADASHEFRTPIASLKTLVEALQAGAGDSPETRQRFFGLLSSEVNRLETLTEKLLLLYRLEEGQTLETTRFDLGELVSECCEGLKVHCPHEGPMVKGDPLLVGQVLTNLLANARAATSGLVDPSIEVLVDPDGTVKVQDNGVGIPEESQDKLFTRFYRVEEDRSRRSGGSGLGLSLSKQIIERHGGSIWFESERDKGSTFYFRLPIERELEAGDE